VKEEKIETNDAIIQQMCAPRPYVIRDENRMHNTEKHDQSISAGLYYTR